MGSVHLIFCQGLNCYVWSDRKIMPGVRSIDVNLHQYVHKLSVGGGQNKSQDAVPCVFRTAASSRVTQATSWSTWTGTLPGFCADGCRSLSQLRRCVATLLHTVPRFWALVLPYQFFNVKKNCLEFSYIYWPTSRLYCMKSSVVDLSIECGLRSRFHRIWRFLI